MTDTSSHAAIYEQIVSSLSSGVLAVDAQGLVITANQAASVHLNVAREYLAPGQRLDAIPDASLPLMRLMDELRDHLETVSRREVTVTTPEGTTVLGITASPLQGEQEFNGVIFLFLDITELRRLEKTAELNRQLAQIGELTAGVVHELRNPLSVISGMAELLMRKSVENDPVHSKSRTILMEAGQMEQLVSQFLSFAKPFTLKPEACIPQLIVDRSLALASPVAEQCGVALECFTQDGLPEILADASKLAQALSNILRNAVEVSPAGKRVLFRTELAGDFIQFRVEDEGPGIHIEKGDDLFSAFFTKKAGGTGLGLSIVHRIVTAHGGTITYGNIPGSGAWFEVLLPRDLPASN